MELTAVAQVRRAFLRLVGTEADDPELVLHGEAANEVVDTYLTRGCRLGQRWMLSVGYQGWRKLSSALSFTDDATNGKVADLPGDFLRAYGNRSLSALVDANGKRWGQEVDADDEHATGSYYMIRGDKIRTTPSAQLPATLLLDYHYTHPAWGDGVTIDFPVDARFLVVCEAANLAKEENWLPGSRDQEMKIERALQRARNEARDIARPSKTPRRMKAPPRIANRW